MERIWKVCTLLVLIILTSCINKDEIIKGYLVYKEYVPAHMDNETPTSVSYLIIIVPHTPVPYRRTPQKVEEAWYWYIANKKEVFKKRVSSQFFNSKRCGDKVIIYKYK